MGGLCYDELDCFETFTGVYEGLNLLPSYSSKGRILTDDL